MIKNKSSVLESQLRAAAQIWDEISKERLPADRWLGNYFHRHRKKFGSRDRKFIAETIYALFRRKTFLETWSARLPATTDSRILVLLAAASEKLIPLPVFEDEIRALASLKAPAADSFEDLGRGNLPAGLSFPSQEEEWSVQFSFPLWMIRRWSSGLGPEKTLSLLRVFQTRPPLVIRANTLKIARKELLEAFKKKRIECAPTPRSPFGIIFKERYNVFESEAFKQGLFEIQDEASQIAASFVDPKPGEVIWDVCAGGGGKSLLLAAMMQNKGRILATDIRAKKLEDLRKRARRAGATNIFPADLARIAEIYEVKKKGIDKIVIDAPCSGTGTLRRNPDAKWKLKEDSSAIFHKDQVQIIEDALPYLKAAGRLYYMTCSIEASENEDVVQEILERHPELRLCREPFEEGWLRLYPDEHGTDGFFVAIADKMEMKRL